VERHHLAQGEIAHLGEATIALEIQGGNSLRGGLKRRVGGRQQVGHGGAREVFDRDAQALGLALKLGGLRRRQFNDDLHEATVPRHPPANKRVKPTAASSCGRIPTSGCRGSAAGVGLTGHHGHQ
jgi:hypothetical protein